MPPPPYFPLLTWLARWSSDPRAYLTALRAIATLGNLLFLGGLLRLGLSVAEERLWAGLGLAYVAFAPRVAVYLVEFRMDGWGYALMTWGLVLFRGRGGGGCRFFEFGVVTGVATLLLNPKPALLPVLIVVCELFRTATGWRRPARHLGAYAAGLAVSCALLAAYLRLNGIGVRETIDCVALYNSTINRHSAFGYGMAREALGSKFLLVPALCGMAWLVAGAVRARRRPDSYLAGTATWLVLQAALVAAPHKQYYAPWFLCAGVFVGLSGQALSRVSRGLGGVAFCAVCAGTTAVVATSAARLVEAGQAGSQVRALTWMGRVALPGDYVVADPQLHPPDRLDTFYFWFDTYDPGGFGGEQAVGTIPALRGRVSEARYRAELRARPPALVLMSMSHWPVSYTERQVRVLNAFLRSSGYRHVEVLGMRVALHPGTYLRASRLGLLPDAGRP